MNEARPRAAHHRDKAPLSKPESSHANSASDTNGSVIITSISTARNSAASGVGTMPDSTWGSKEQASSMASSATAPLRRGTWLSRSLTRLFSRGSVQSASLSASEDGSPALAPTAPPQLARHRDSRHPKASQASPQGHRQAATDNDDMSLRRQPCRSRRRRLPWLSSLRKRRSWRHDYSQRQSSSLQDQHAQQQQQQQQQQQKAQIKRDVDAREDAESSSVPTGEATATRAGQSQQQRHVSALTSSQQRAPDSTVAAQLQASPSNAPHVKGDGAERSPLNSTVLFEPPPARRELPPLPMRHEPAAIPSLLHMSPTETAAATPMTGNATSVRDSGLSAAPDTHREKESEGSGPSVQTRARAGTGDCTGDGTGTAHTAVAISAAPDGPGTNASNNNEGEDDDEDDGDDVDDSEAHGGQDGTKLVGVTLQHGNEGGDGGQMGLQQPGLRATQEAWRETPRTPGLDDDGYSTASLASSNISTTRTKRGLGPLHLAAVEGNTPALRCFLTRASVHVDTTDADGVTPFILATLSRQYKTAQLLLDHGADVNHRDKHGRTALHWVTYNGLCKSLRWLLQHGADWRLKDGAGRSSLHWAAGQRDHRCMGLLLSRLSRLSSTSSTSPPSFMARASVSTSLLSRTSRTSRSASSSSSSLLPWVSRLLRSHPSASISPQQPAAPATTTTAAAGNAGGVSPSSTATAGNETAASEAGLGGLLDAVDCQAMTALAWACHHGHLQHIKLLLKHGARTNIPNAQGRVCMHHVVQQPFSACAQQLMRSARSGLFVRDNDGRTPLHLASMHGSVKMTRLLFQGAHAALTSTSGAMQDLHGIVDLNAFCQAKDNQGRTPLHFAAVMGHTGVCATLISMGHAPDVYDDSNHLPVYYARVKGHSETMEYLTAAVVRAHEEQQQQALLSIGMGDAGTDDASTALPSDYAVF